MNKKTFCCKMLFMAYDSLTLSVLIRELNETLSGGKISKIAQPEKDEVVFTVFRGASHRLVMSANPSINRLHLTEYAKENPLAPPNFCMLLRKHLTNSTVESISQMPYERVADFTLKSKNELGYTETKHLLFELTGKTANLVLTDGEYVIFDTMKHLPVDLDTQRIMLPGAKYEFFAARDKIRPDEKEKITALTTSSAQDIDGIFAKNLLGVSSATVAEMLFGINKSDHSPENAVRAAEGAAEYLSRLAEPRPNIVFEGQHPAEVYPFDYKSVKRPKAFYPTLNKAHDEFYFLKDRALRTSQKTKHLSTVIKNAVNRLEKKIAIQEQSVLDCAESEKFKNLGDMILANIHAYRQGAEKMTVTDYSREDCPQVEIALDKTLSPQKNAQEYFKKYKKMKNTLAHAKGLLEENKGLLEYIKGVREYLKFSVTDGDLAEIAEELAKAGFIKNNAAREKRTQPAAPLHYVIEGLDVYAGKNNIQNEALIKKAKPGDLWLHTHDMHSAHVVIETNQQIPPESVIVTAAEITAYYSPARGGGKTVVDYTSRKNLKKPPDSNPGYVIYSSYSTVVVTANEHKELLKK